MDMIETSGSDRVARLRDILASQGRLMQPASTLSIDDDLFTRGLDSLAIVNVMLAMEDAFGVELPDSMLNRRTFGSLGALDAAIASLQGVA